MSDSLTDLRVLVQVVESGSLTAAAQVLDISVNTVSRRLRQLEESLDVALIHRSTRSLSVTDEGQRFYRHCVRILHEYDEARRELERAPDELSGMVRAAVPTQAIQTGFIEEIAALHQRNPSLCIQLTVTDQLVDLIGGAYDVAIRFTQPHDSSALVARVATVLPRLAAASSYLDEFGRPSKVSDLAEHHCLCFLSENKQDSWVLLSEDGTREEVAVKGWFECDSSDALARAMHVGMGIGLVVGNRPWPSPTLEAVLPAYTLEPIPAFAVYPQGRRGSPEVLAFIDAYRRCMRSRSYPP